MATPNLKLLLHALRLGQPQDPQASIFALAEALTAKDEELDELRRRMSLMESHARLLEAKVANLTEQVQDERDGGAVPSRMAPRSVPPQAHAPQQPQQQGPSGQLAVAQAAPAQHPSQRPPPMHASQHPPAHHSAPHPSQRPPPHSGEQPAHRDDDFKRSTARMNADLAKPQPQAQPQAQAGPQSRGIPRAPIDSEDSEDDFNNGTLVVSSRDVHAAIQSHQEAPFRIAPAGTRNVPPQASIPGAPWAKGRGGTARAPVPQDEFTVDMPSLLEEEDEGETYHDRGSGQGSGSLGRTPADPGLPAGRSPSSDGTPLSDRTAVGRRPRPPYDKR